MATNNNSETKEGDGGVVSEEEYEGDQEEERRLLGMRRRKAASDDEEEEEGGGGEREEKVVGDSSDRRGHVRSDDSESEGGAADYDDVEGELGSEEEEYVEYVEYEEGEDGVASHEEGEGERNGEHVEEERREESEVVGSNVAVEVEDGNVNEEGEEGKKENEPFAVPTAGVFYMHDDRFRDNAGGRNRRTYGGRRLWESKDDKKWGHDKFEELTIEDRDYGQGRKTSRGRYRGHSGKNGGPDRGHTRRSRPKSFGNGINPNQEPQVVRGRGPRKYETSMKGNSRVPSVQNRQPPKSVEKTLHGSPEKASGPVVNTEPDEVAPARKLSNLSSASPPFYPSGSSNKDINLIQKRDVQAGNTSKNLQAPVINENLSMQRTSGIVRGKNISTSAGLNRSYIDDAVTAGAAKPSSNSHMPLPGSSLPNTYQSSQSLTQGRGQANSGKAYNQQATLHSQVSRPVSHLNIVQQTDPSHTQFSVQASGQQSYQNPRSGSSPTKTTLSKNSHEMRESEAASDSDKSRTALVGKGKASVQASGRGPFMFNGTQVMGATGNMGSGDQNFPAFLPVMQFGGQHPGGIRVPAVGMAFPGYVGQPQLGGSRNSEMTWLPVLTGAAGALGATYCPPYIAVDGAYHAHSSGQASVISSSSKEGNTNNKSNSERLSQGPDITNNDSGQRQKPRRYSEMDFKQSSTST